MLFYFLFQFQVIREHCRGKVPKVVAAAHHASVGTGAADGEDVASLAVGQFAAFAPNVTRLANRTDDIVKSLALGAIYDIVLNPPASFNPPVGFNPTGFPSPQSSPARQLRPGI